MNRGEEKKKGGGTVHTVVSEVPPYLMDSDKDEEEYTGPRPLQRPPGWPKPPPHPLCELAGRLVDLQKKMEKEARGGTVNMAGVNLEFLFAEIAAAE